QSARVASDEVVRALKVLPHVRQYERIRYEPLSPGRAVVFVAARSGGISATAVAEVLKAIPLDSWWHSFSSPWRLAVHGDATYARVTVLSGECGDAQLDWLL